MSLMENNGAGDHEAKRAVGERGEVVAARGVREVPDPELAEDANHLREVERVMSALRKVGVAVFWEADDGTVRVER